MPLGGQTPNTIYYRAAAIQLDVILNKKGWHFPQQRMLALWGDVIPTIYGDPANGGAQKAPEPLFFRANCGDCVEYWHTNLVPNYYELDNFQVRTPTDVIGQHIHLVKFDVTSSDGAANGFNYEDGTASPGEVQERIKAINADGGISCPTTRARCCRSCPYYFCSDPTAPWFAANCSTNAVRTTILHPEVGGEAEVGELLRHLGHGAVARKR
jgi:manganese oxidase